MIKHAEFCFYCRYFGVIVHHNDNTFISEGFSTWATATARYNKHQETTLHKSSTIAYLNRISTENNKCATLINSAHAKQVEFNRRNFKRIIESVVYLAKQGLAFRGHDESESSINQGNIKNSQVKVKIVLYKLGKGSINQIKTE